MISLYIPARGTERRGKRATRGPTYREEAALCGVPERRQSSWKCDAAGYLAYATILSSRLNQAPLWEITPVTWTHDADDRRHVGRRLPNPDVIGDACDAALRAKFRLPSEWLLRWSVPATRAGALLEAKFAALAHQWREETAALSSSSMIAMNQSYQRIIGMGQPVLPLIMREMSREPDHWFWALMAITGENPVAPDDVGDLEKMTDSWLRMGRERGWTE